MSAHVNTKERNRLIVKRNYYRKLTTLGELRIEAERLEARYQELIEAEYAASLGPSSAEELAQKTRCMEIRGAFVKLAMTSKALRLENKRLQVTKTEKEKTESELAHLYIAQCKKAEHIQERMMAKKQKPTIHVRNITSTECTEIMSETYERINVFRESTESFTSGMSVFGWRDCYRYEDKDIDFSLTKTYRHHSMESVSGMVWNLFRHGATFAQLYPKSVTATFNEVQRLDDNNLLYFHTLEMGQQSDMRTKCFLLLCSRMSVMDGDGCVLIFRTLDPHRYVISEGEVAIKRDRRGRHKIEPKVEEAWIDVFMWALYRRSGPNGEHCASEAGGTLFATPILEASFWLVERLQCMMKVEQLIFGPSNLLIL